jgi:hypothetical protein
MSSDNLVTETQAYAAMVFFLENIYKRAPDDALGGLLDALSWHS